MCHSFQRWTRWVVRKRMQAAAASSSPLASRTPACWRASPSCSSWRRTLDRYSWASSRLLQDHHQLLLEPKQREAGSKFLLYFFLLFSFFGFWTLGILVVRQVRPIVFWSYTRSCFSAEGSRSRVWRPCLLSVSILSAQLPWKRPETSTEAVAKDGYTWCAIPSPSLSDVPLFVRLLSRRLSSTFILIIHPGWCHWASTQASWDS